LLAAIVRKFVAHFYEKFAWTRQHARDLGYAQLEREEYRYDTSFACKGIEEMLLLKDSTTQVTGDCNNDVCNVVCDEVTTSDFRGCC